MPGVKLYTASMKPIMAFLLFSRRVMMGLREAAYSVSLPVTTPHVTCQC